MNFYLNKYGFVKSQIKVKPDFDVGIIVVIPCFNETNLLATLDSLCLCSLPAKKVEVIVVFNSGAHDSSEIKNQNLIAQQEMEEWVLQNKHKGILFYSLLFDELPTKHAGVGLARKIGMDEAVSRFYTINHDGIIVCFDADSTCDSNYLTEIENHFNRYPKSPGCSIYFEHPIDTESYSNEISEGITQYELHLRYYNQALRYCKLPYAFHTVGSSMAVRSSAYQKQGGMNKRKAGEDFYFLHKIISLGNFSELNSTRVIPSPRVSDRVPFGTGKAIGDFLDKSDRIYFSYCFKSFDLIKEFVQIVSLLYKKEMSELTQDLGKKNGFEVLIAFLKQEKFDQSLNEIRKNSKTEDGFLKRFFVWFDAFRVLKLVHYLRDHLYPNEPISKVSSQMAVIVFSYKKTENTSNLLAMFRKVDRLSNYKVF